MKTYLTTIICLFLVGNTLAQCPTTDMILTSQEDVDNFALDYPDCTDLSIHMTIRENFTTPIINLSGLANITMITGELEISHNDDLTSLEGLENVTTIPGELYINSNDGLTSLTGLENLNSVGALNINGHENIT